MKYDRELKLRSFYSDRYFYISQEFLTPRVAVFFLGETRYSTSIYHLGTPFWSNNTPKYSLGESILLAKTKEYTLLYIPCKFQGV